MPKSGKKKLKSEAMASDKKPAILEEAQAPEEAKPHEAVPKAAPESLQLQVMRARLSELITDDERDELSELLVMPGFKVMMKMARLLQADWGDQLINANYRNSDRDLISNFVVNAQGMKHGLVAYFRMMAVLRKALKQEKKK